MEIAKGKAKATLIALFLTLTIAITLVAVNLPTADAQSTKKPMLSLALFLILWVLGKKYCSTSAFQHSLISMVINGWIYQ
jgi:hypothetical protein